MLITQPHTTSLGLQINIQLPLIHGWIFWQKLGRKLDILSWKFDNVGSSCYILINCLFIHKHPIQRKNISPWSLCGDWWRVKEGAAHVVLCNICWHPTSSWPDPATLPSLMSRHRNVDTKHRMQTPWHQQDSSLRCDGGDWRLEIELRSWLIWCQLVRSVDTCHQGHIVTQNDAQEIQNFTLWKDIVWAIIIMCLASCDPVWAGAGVSQGWEWGERVLLASARPS